MNKDLNNISATDAIDHLTGSADDADDDLSRQVEKLIERYGAEAVCAEADRQAGKESDEYGDMDNAKD